tara:strand:+ start:259 stop:522 length:264 start_codon:yes stop_codon:yes gene_type:complete
MKGRRIIAKSYLTKREAKEGRIMLLSDAEKMVKRRRKQGYRVISEPHDGASFFSRFKTLKLRTKTPGEYKTVRVEKKIWDISDKKVK